MYDASSQAPLNTLLATLKPELDQTVDWQPFYTRLGSNFHSFYQLYQQFYGHRADFQAQLQQLVATMAQQYQQRDETLRQSDLRREQDANWFLKQQWVGMAMYTDRFADNLAGVRKHTGYLQELGVNMVHLMPMMECPKGASDGGYAVSDFCRIDERFGNMEDLRALAQDLHQQGALLTMDVVLNHTSDEHEWAQKARQGDPVYQDYYYVFDDRIIPDQYEAGMLEIFPDNAPGNFTWDEAMGKWVMTVFNRYQWDLNYTNPAVFREILNVILFWANQGADILRLDAVAFLWKKIGSVSQNEREAHQILQMLKDCLQITTPGTLFIAEAIVSPREILKYFGENTAGARECDIAYNATFMALLWDALATHNTRLLRQTLNNLPAKPAGATWLNYVRCHDDIGLGYDDNDIHAAGYNVKAHRDFLVDYFTGRFPGSPAQGLPFGYNEKTGDTRISGSLASLAGLEAALTAQDESATDTAIRKILLVHSLIMAYGGIPLLYYGDELGTLNDHSYLEDPDKANDNRWAHRSRMDWQRAEQRHEPGSVEQRIFSGLQHMISVRKETAAFADITPREMVHAANPHLFVFVRRPSLLAERQVWVLANFDSKPHYLHLDEMGAHRPVAWQDLRDLYSDNHPEIDNDLLKIPAHGFYWLVDNI